VERLGRKKKGELEGAAGDETTEQEDMKQSFTLNFDNPLVLNEKRDSDGDVNMG